MEIFDQIKKEIKYWEDTSLDCNPTYAPTIPSVLELIGLYWNSKYKFSEKDSSGWRKPFYNIVENPTYVAAKMIDFDTKDIQIVAEEGQDFWTAWLMKKEFGFWAKIKGLGQLINRSIVAYPKWGHLVLKKVGDNIEMPWLKNLRFDPEVRPSQSPFLGEFHKYTFEELKKVGKERGWENVEEVIEAYRAKKKTLVEAYERYGEVEDSENDFFIMAGLDIGLRDERGILAFDKKVKRPYRDLPWEEVEGRSIGRGQVEKLFEAQIAKNEVNYYFNKGLQWTSLHIFQSRDETIARNLLTDIENGEILRVLSEITPVAVEERNLASYNYADQKWNKNIADRTFSYEPLSGQRPPVGTPLGTSILQTKMAGQYYGLQQENLGLFFRDIILDWVLPNFKKEKGGKHKTHIMNLIGNDEQSEKFFNLLLAHRVNQRQLEMLRNGKWLFPEDLEIIKGIQAELLRKENFNIPENLYKDLKYKLDVVITGEQIDLGAKISTLQVILQILGSNPTVMQDKRMRRIFYRLMDWSGINPEEIMGDEKEISLPETIAEVRAQRGGSIAAPPITPTRPEMTQVSTRL